MWKMSTFSIIPIGTAIVDIYAERNKILPRKSFQFYVDEMDTI